MSAQDIRQDMNMLKKVRESRMLGFGLGQKSGNLAAGNHNSRQDPLDNFMQSSRSIGDHSESED